MDKRQREKLTNLIEAFVRISNKFGLIRDRILDYGSGDLLHPAEIHMLNCLSKNRDQNITEIGMYFGISKSAASQTIMKLEKKGFCAKYKKENSKNIYMKVTEKGLFALQNFHAYHNDLFDDLIEQFESSSAEEIIIIDRAFKSIEKHMDTKLKKTENVIQ